MLHYALIYYKNEYEYSTFCGMHSCNRGITRILKHFNFMCEIIFKVGH